MMKETTMKISAFAALIAVLSILAVSAAQAGSGASGGVEWHKAPACDAIGRSQKTDDGDSDRCQVVAGGDMTDGEPNRSTAALSIGDAEFRVAASRPSGTGDIW
jgi:hypothetical protein